MMENRSLMEEEEGVRQQGVESKAHFAEGHSLYLAISLMALIILMGCTGNIMAILAVRMTKKLQTVSNMFIVNLSVCDLLFVTLILPFNLYTYISDGWYLDESLCKFVGILGYSLTGTTIITITLIAWNRYKMVTDLTAYKRIFLPWNIGVMLLVAWVFPMICLLPSIIGVWGEFGYVPIMVTCNLVLSHESQSFKLFLLIFRALIPSVLIIYFYATIYKTTRASHRRLSRPSLLSTVLNDHNHRREMHMTRMMIMIFVVFALSYFPCTVTSVIDWNKVLSKQYHMFCSITIYIGSAANPLIYGLMNSQFRNAYISIVTCKKRKMLFDRSPTMSRVSHLYKINQSLSNKKLLLCSSLLPGNEDSTPRTSPELSTRDVEKMTILPQDTDNENED